VCSSDLTFELPAFSSEDSLEYIRFKLASAGFRKPLPLNGGELGQIHVRAAGIPGQLNWEIAPALVAATTPEPDRAPAAQTASLFSLGRRYWAAAGGLVLVLGIVLMLPPAERSSDAAETDIATSDAAGRQQISVAVEAGTATASPAPADESQRQTGSSSLVTSADANTDVNTDTATRAPAQPVAVDRAPTTAAVTAAQPAEVRQPAPAERMSAVEQAVVASGAKSAAEINGLSGFEQQLLSYSPQSYVVQIMGSRSPANIQRFLDGTPALAKGGYFATTHQGEPWYVVIAGQFDDRRSAEDAIAQLPATVQEYRPWVRSLADVQASIRSHYRLP